MIMIKLFHYFERLWSSTNSELQAKVLNYLMFSWNWHVDVIGQIIWTAIFDMFVFHFFRFCSLFLDVCISDYCLALFDIDSSTPVALLTVAFVVGWRGWRAYKSFWRSNWNYILLRIWLYYPIFAYKHSSQMLGALQKIRVCPCCVYQSNFIVYIYY